MRSAPAVKVAASVSTVTFWIGSIYGEASSDPGDPRVGVYFMVTGTLAHTLFEHSAKGRLRNATVSPTYSRGAAVLQFEIAGIDKDGENAGFGFFQAFTFYGSPWDAVPLPSQKLKDLERLGFLKKVGIPGKAPMYRGTLKPQAGIALTIYLLLIWVNWTDEGLELNDWFGVS